MLSFKYSNSFIGKFLTNFEINKDQEISSSAINGNYL